MVQFNFTSKSNSILCILIQTSGFLMQATKQRMIFLLILTSSSSLFYVHIIFQSFIIDRCKWKIYHLEAIAVINVIWIKFWALLEKFQKIYLPGFYHIRYRSRNLELSCVIGKRISQLLHQHENTFLIKILHKFQIFYIIGPIVK